MKCVKIVAQSLREGDVSTGHSNSDASFAHLTAHDSDTNFSAAKFNFIICSVNCMSNGPLNSTPLKDILQDFPQPWLKTMSVTGPPVLSDCHIQSHMISWELFKSLYISDETQPLNPLRMTMLCDCLSIALTSPITFRCSLGWIETMLPSVFLRPLAQHAFSIFLVR